MAAPWEKYATATAEAPDPAESPLPPWNRHAQAQGPWSRYQGAVPAEAPPASSPSLPERMRGLVAEEPDTTYGEVLPLKKSEKTGKTSLAVPGMVRSVVRGAAELLEGAHGDLPVGKNLSPDAIGALMTIPTEGRGIVPRAAKAAAKPAAEPLQSAPPKLQSEAAKVGKPPPDPPPHAQPTQSPPAPPPPPAKPRAMEEQPLQPPHPQSSQRPP